MSICDHHPTVEHDSISGASTPQEPKLILQDELVWGLSYRHYKKKEKEVPIPPKKSPIDIPFKLCREKQRQQRKRHPSKTSTSKSQAKSKKENQPSLLEKSVMSQSRYMEYLAIPRKIEMPPPLKRRKHPCELEPCPPRFVQLAVPNKRRVYENWKAYHEMLPTEVIVRYEQLLHTDKNLEPREARYYYKRLDKKKRKELKKRLKQKKKKQAEKEKGNQSWLNEQIDLTVDAIMEYIKEEPLFTLNFKQVMLSDGILDRLDKAKLMDKPSRKTKNHYKKTVIEVSDKLAVWMDTLTRFVDIQAIDSEEDIPPLTISSLPEEFEEEEEEVEEEEVAEEGLEEEEGEEGEEGEELEDEEGEMEEGLGEGLTDTEFLFKEELDEMLWEEGEEGVWGADLGVGGGKSENEIIGDLVKGKSEELDMALLAQLIEILENSPEEILESLVNEEKMPGVTFADILEKLKALQAGLYSKEEKKRPLEDIISDWAKKNDPDKVDDNMMKEIHNVAEKLGEWWSGGLIKGEEKPEEEDKDEQEDTGKDLEDDVDGKVDVGSGTLADEEEDEDDDKKGGDGEDGEAVEGKDAAEGTEDRFPEGGHEFDVIGQGEGGDVDNQLDLTGYPETEKEEELLAGSEGEGEVGQAEEPFEKIQVTDEKPPELNVIYDVDLDIASSDVGQVIKGHKPSITFEHAPNMVCCLSLKTWAVWLLEITHNAHNWTKWVHGVIRQVREFASTIRGDVVGPDGKKKVLYKKDWRNFTQEVEEMIVAWRQYSAHVKELSTSIVDNFHGKEVKCCPKCLQDHLIKNVVTAHETLQALTEAMNCAGYWQRCLDEIVAKTTTLTDIEQLEKEIKSDQTETEEDEETDAYLEELPPKQSEEEDDGESVYEIEEIHFSSESDNNRQPPPCGPCRKF